MVGEKANPKAAEIDFSRPIPIFPLPNCVLLPRAVRPLHVFEPRYRKMIRDTLDEQSLVAIALLKPGYETRYYTHFAAIHPMLCLGRIIRHERLPDGRYNALLQGVCRARIIREDQQCCYRRGLLAPMQAAVLPGDANDRIRARLIRVVAAATAATVSPSGVLAHVLRCADLSLSDALDLAAFDAISDPLTLQRFLDEPDVIRRAARLEKLLAHAATAGPQTSLLRSKHDATYVCEN